MGRSGCQLKHIIKRPHPIEAPFRNYDEQVEMLKMLERLSLEHMQLLKAFAQEPDIGRVETMGSVGNTLSKRIPQVSNELRNELLEDLQQMRLVSEVCIAAMITGAGANDLRSHVSSRGQRILEYTKNVAFDDEHMR